MRLALVLLLAASAAFAAVPEKGEGTITLLGGARYIPGNGDYVNEQFASHKVFQPGFLASFGYQYDDELHFKIEIGYMLDHYRMPVGGDLTVKSIPILLALDTALWRGERFTLYGGGGIGYSLNTGTRNGTNNEANSTAGYLALGLRWQLGGPVAAVLEERYTIASAEVDAGNSQRILNVGGNLVSLGLMFHFFQPEEKGHPTDR
jgi:opacity protein-like surface antigen